MRKTVFCACNGEESWQGWRRNQAKQMENKVKIQGIEYSEKDLWSIYNSGKNILVKFRNAYVLEYGKNVGFCAIPIYRHYGDLPMMPKGRHLWVDENGLNKFKF